MSYPVILYPKLIQEFRRDNPLPSKVMGVAERAGDRFPNSSKSSEKPKTTNHWFVYPLIVVGYNLLLLVVGPLPVTSLLQRILVVAVGALALVVIVRLLSQDYERLKKSVRVTDDDEPPTLSSIHEPLLSPKAPQSQMNAQSQGTGRGKLLRERLVKLATVLHRRVMQPLGISDAPVGISEAAFGQVLESFFPGRVRSQLEFPIPGSEHSYSTDLALLFDEINLAIDCEIDEPYELKSKMPTHCVDQHKDRYRNQFFLTGNWIVVRFSEEQVVRYPESCCKELASVIATVTGIERYLLKFENVPTLPLKPQWTFRQARRMASRSYRFRYLP